MGRRIVVVLTAAALAACGAPDTARPPVAPLPAPLPSTVRVVCGASGTRIATPVVRPRPDGVHIKILNRLSADPGYSIAGEGGGNAPPGVSHHVWQLAPGPHRAGCYLPLGSDQSEPDERPFVVRDTRHLFVDPEVDCLFAAHGVIDYAAGAKGKKGNPVDVARDIFARYLKPGDRVERAGYPSAPMAVVRLVRAGRTLATAELSKAGNGGWLEDETVTCDELGG